jgi:hypothetical protein
VTSFLRNCGFFKTSRGGMTFIKNIRKISPIIPASTYRPKTKNNVAKIPWIIAIRRIMKKLYFLGKKYKGNNAH